MIDPIIQAILMFMAVVVSIVGSIVVAIWNARDTATVNIIREEYKAFLTLTQLQVTNWQMSHLYCVAKEYPMTKEMVQATVNPTLTEQQKAEYHLKEMNVAIYILTMYEQTVWQLGQSKTMFFHGKRAAFMAFIHRYFTNFILPNPRMRFWWDSEGGNLQSLFEKETIGDYNLCVMPIISKAKAEAKAEAITAKIEYVDKTIDFVDLFGVNQKRTKPDPLGTTATTPGSNP